VIYGNTVKNFAKGGTDPTGRKYATMKTVMGKWDRSGYNLNEKK